MSVLVSLVKKVFRLSIPRPEELFAVREDAHGVLRKERVRVRRQVEGVPPDEELGEEADAVDEDVALGD